MTGYKEPPKEHQWKPGQSGNPGGKPRGLKNYDQEKFARMTDKEKEVFLKTISPELRYKMAEGNPANATDLTTGGEALQIVFHKAFENGISEPTPKTGGSSKEQG